MTIDRSVFLINPPEAGKAPYFLIIYRSGGPFGGSRPTVVAVHDFRHIYSKDEKEILAYRGMDDAERVCVEFPPGTPYLLLSADRLSVVTPAEAAMKQKEEEEEMEKILGPIKEHAGVFEASADERERKGYL